MFGAGMANAGFYQPYMQGISSGLGASSVGRGSLSGLGKGLLSKFSFTGLLNGASKTLNVVNQAIPIFYQVKPMVSNAKTMFRVMGAMKDTNSKNNTVIKKTTKPIIQKNNTTVSPNYSIMNQEYQEENPVFFI